MATYWVSVSGSNTNDGSSYAQAFRFMDRAIDEYLSAGSKGDIINVADDGYPNYLPLDKVINTNAGTSWDDPGLIIRGVDSAGTKTLATVIINSAWTNSSECFYVRAGGGWIILEGLLFDRTETSGVSTQNYIRHRDRTAGPVWYRACEVRDLSGNASVSAGALLYDDTTAPHKELGISRISHCVFDNVKGNIAHNSSVVSGTSIEFIDNVVVTFGINIDQSYVHGQPLYYTGGSRLMTGNTIVARTAAAQTFQFDSYVGGAFGTARMTLVTAHTNLFLWRYINDFVVSSPPFSGRGGTSAWFGGSNISSNVTPVLSGEAPEKACLIGWNTFITAYSGDTTGGTAWNGGPYISATTQTRGYYEPDWDTTGLVNHHEPWPTDTNITNLDISGATAAVADSGVTWTWVDAGGFGYNLTVPEDYRLITATTAGYGGVTPGALGSAFGTITVDSNLSGSETLTYILTGDGGNYSITSSTVPATYEGLTIGDGNYGIKWLTEIDQYETPGDNFPGDWVSGTVTSNDTLVFPGYYSPTACTIQVLADGTPTARWELSGSVAYTGVGTQTLYDQPTGKTDITWGFIANWITPVLESQTSQGADVISFSGSYSADTASTAVRIVNGVPALTTNFSLFNLADPTEGEDGALGLPLPGKGGGGGRGSWGSDIAFDRFDPTDTKQWQNYEFLVFSSDSGEILANYGIRAVTATTAYTMFEFAGIPDLSTSGLKYAISPTRATKEKFFKDKSYERNLLEGYPGRTNTWPTHSAATDLLLFAGSEYETFLETELAWALSADTVGTSPQTNILWSKLTPQGIKNLDNDDAVLQKFVLTLGMSFDKIKNYQDQMAFTHTIGYQDYDHVPRSLVRQLAKLWGWSLNHDSKNNDLTTYKLALYDHYATGTTDNVSNLSPEDINFERWRRITSNLVRIFKAKGTRKAMELVLDVYGIPADLLVLKEYVYFSDANIQTWMYLREIPSGVFVITGNTRQREWMDRTDASINVTIDFPIYNARFLDIGLSEAEAITRNVYDWAQDTDQTFTDVNGVTIELSGYTGDRYNFEHWMVQQFIPSDGSHRTATNYPKLEALYSSYLGDSVSAAYKFGDFEAFITFIEENFMEITRQLIPASSRLLAQGTIIENLPWHREKYVYQPEGDVKQPFNEEKIFRLPTLSGSQATKVTAATPTFVASGASQASPTGATTIGPLTAEAPVKTSCDIEFANVTAYRPLQFSTTMPTAYISPTYIEQPQDTWTFTESPSGSVFTIDTPAIGPSGLTDSGSVIFTAFNSSALIVTNDNKFDLYLSAANMSQSGMNRVVIELFRKLDEDDIAEIRSSAFTVMQTVYEGSDFNPSSNNIGTYRLNSVRGLAVGDLMSATSAVDLYINTSVKILNIYSGSNKIVTSPPIGVDNLPIGKNASRVALRTLFNSEVVSHLIRAIEEELIPYDYIMETVGFLYSELPPVEKRTLSDVAKFAQFLGELSKARRPAPTMDDVDAPDNVPEDALWVPKYVKQPLPPTIGFQTLVGVFRPFYFFTVEQLAGCSIVVPFLRDNPDFTLSTDRIYLPDLMINKIAQVRLQKVNDLFDWARPVQQVVIQQYDQQGWEGFPYEITLGTTSESDHIISGRTEIGGLDDLNANILRDKEEYFIRYKADAEVPQEYTGETYLQKYSGRTIASSNYPLQIINNIYYYGNYFVYMKTSKEPIFDSIPIDSGQTDTASVELQFKGVGDSDQIEVQFLDAGPAPDPDVPTGGPSQTTGVGSTSDAYTGITSSNWATATTIVVDVKLNADDRTQYTLQTTLDANRWYWWRVRNTKQKLTTFGYVLESITHSEPKLFFTGDYKDLDSEEGENPDIPEPPDDPGGGGGGGTKFTPIELG